MAQAPKEVLDRVLESAGADGFDLPPLVEQHDDSPSLLMRLLKWIESLLPKPDPNSHASQFIPILVKGFLILLLVMLLVMAVSLVFTYFRRAAQKVRDLQLGSKRSSGETPREQLQLNVEAALRAGRIGEAARLRWKLHLVRIKLPSSITPGEMEGFGRFYPLMFGGAGESGGEPSQRLFNELDLSLRAREAETR